MGRHLKIFSVAIAFAFLMNACAKTSGFHTEEMKPMIQIPQSEPERAKEKVSPPPVAGSIVRHSRKIQINEMGSPVLSAGKTSVKAKLSVNGHDYGDVEFKGTRKDSKILLEPVNPELQGKLKATAYCISDECDQYFIDVFYKEDEVYYHDQFQTTQAPSKAEEPVNTPKAPPQNEKDPKTKESPTPTKPVEPAPKKTPAPKELPKPLPPVQDDPHLIPDDIPATRADQFTRFSRPAQ